MSYLVKFSNVGHAKKSWETVIKEVDEISILKAVKKNKAIMSRFPEIEFNGNGNGEIVCGFRTCGTFTFSEVQP